MRWSPPVIVGTILTLAAIVFRLWVNPEARLLLDAVTWSMIVGGIGVALTVGAILRDHFEPLGEGTEAGDPAEE